jgi:ElaB/YqjD/DUF883 family membrane-anchored ribosome-binding protein
MKGSMGTNGISETAAEAQGTIVDTAQMLRDTASDVAGRAQEVAGEVGRQASAAAQSAYSTGNEALDVVEGLVRENVWAGLLIAGAVGYGLACLVKSAR